MSVCEDITKVCFVLHNVVKEKDGYNINDTFAVMTVYFVPWRMEFFRYKQKSKPNERGELFITLFLCSFEWNFIPYTCI